MCCHSVSQSDDAASVPRSALCLIHRRKAAKRGRFLSCTSVGSDIRDASDDADDGEAP